MDSEDFLEILVESLDEGVMAMGPDGRMLLVNREAERLTGISREHLMSGRWVGDFELFRADGRTPYPMDRLPLARAARGRVVDREELLLRRPGREDLWVEVRARPLLRGGGAVAVFSDVTARQRAREESRLHGRLLQALRRSRAWRSGLLAFLEVAADHLDWSRGEAWTAPELTAGVRYHRGEPEAPPGQPSDLCRRAAESGAPEWRTQGGVLAVAVPVKSGDRVEAVLQLEGPGSPEDTVPLLQSAASQVGPFLAQRRAEDTVRRLHTGLRLRQRELEAANREIEDFACSVSHDLRAPLRTIDGFASLLEDQADRLDADGRRSLRIVRSAVREMSNLLDDLVKFARLGQRPMERERVDMTELAQSVAEAVGVEAQVEPLPPASGDPILLRQVLANLLDNARKFTSRREHPAIRVTGGQEGGEVRYSVRDNGAGFPPDQAHRLFRVFQRLHRQEEFPGTGSGLAIVHRVVARHGGRVWAEGAPGRGATFSFALPMETADDLS